MRAHVIFGLVCAAATSLGGCSGSGERQAGPVERSTFHVDAVLAVGPEIGTDAPVPIQQNTGFGPDVASDGTNYFAVFQDGSSLRGVRVDATGTVLDMPWLRFEEPGATADAFQGEASVAFGAGRYLVVWTQADGVDTVSVQGRMVRADGTVEGDASFRISSGSTASEPSVAWNGARFVVAWTSFVQNGTSDIRVTLVGSDGTVVAGSEHAVSTSGKGLRASVTAGTATALVAWEDQQTGVGLIRAARVGSDGTVLDPGGVRVSDAETTEDEVELASDGTSFLVAWRKGGSPATIRASVLSDAGTVTAKDFAVSHSTAETGSPSVAFDGADYLVTWADDRDGRGVYGTQVSATGQVSPMDDELADGKPWQLLNNNTSLTFGGEAYLVAFQGTGIEGSLIDPNLAVIDGGLELTPLPNKQGSPNVGWNGQNYLVSWVDEREPSFENYSARGVRVDARGRVLDPAGLVLSGDKTAFSHDSATNSLGSHVVVWANTAGEAWQRSVTGSGELSAPSSLALTGQSTSPGIATNGDGYLVVFSDSQTSSTSSVSGRLLDAAGAASAPFIIESAAQIDFADALSAGQDYLVRYRKAGTWLVPVSRTGTLGERMQLSTSIAHVTTATNGSHTLLVWTDISDDQVRGRLYSAGAWQGDAFVISPTSAGYGAAVAWDGSTYWVVWENDPDAHPLYARSVSESGEQSPATLLVEDDCNAPALASDGNGQMLLSYYKFSESARVRRVVSRLLGNVPTQGEEGGAGGGGGATSTEPPEAGAGGEPASGGTAASGSAGTPSSAGSSSGGRASGGSNAMGGSSGMTSGGGLAGSAGSTGGGGSPSCSASRGAGAGERGAGFALSMIAAGLAVARLRARAAGTRARATGSRSFRNS